MPVYRSTSQGPRLSRPQKRYRIPGDPPEGLDAGTDAASGGSLVGGVGLRGIDESDESDIPAPATPTYSTARYSAPFRSHSSRSRSTGGDTPTLPFHDFGKTNPGLYSVATPDLLAMDRQRDAASAEAPYRKMETLKSAKDLWSVAGSDPAVAREIGGVLTEQGLPAYGRAIAGVRDESPVDPAAGPESSMTAGLANPAHYAETYAKELGRIVAMYKRARPDLDHEHHVKAAVEYLQANPAWAGVKAMAEGYGREYGQYQAKLDPQYGEPALLSAKGTAERENYGLATPGVVARARDEAAARQDEETAGAYDRESDKLDLETERGIPMKLFQKRREADIAFDLEGDKKGLDYATSADIAEQRAIGREQGKRRFGAAGKRGNQEDSTAAAEKSAREAFEKDREMAHKDLEEWLKTTEGGAADGNAQRRYELEALRFRRGQRAQALPQAAPQQATPVAPAAPPSAPPASQLTPDQIRRAQDYLAHPDADPAKAAALRARLAAAGVR